MDMATLLMAIMQASNRREKAQGVMKEELISILDMDAGSLVIMRLIGEKLNLWDSATFSDILDQHASKYYMEIKNKNVPELLDYWRNSIIARSTPSIIGGDRHDDNTL